MTTYCKECAVWVGSDDAKMMNHDGKIVIHRWCSYDRKYRAIDQNIYSCRGYVPIRRVLTKLCEILNIEPTKFFNSFDEVRENYLLQTAPELFAQYNAVSEYISNGLDNLPNKEEVAKALFNSYIIDAEAYARVGHYCEAVNKYSEMVRTLHIMFDVMNENTLFHKIKK